MASVWQTIVAEQERYGAEGGGTGNTESPPEATPPQATPPQATPPQATPPQATPPAEAVVLLPDGTQQPVDTYFSAERAEWQRERSQWEGREQLLQNLVQQRDVPDASGAEGDTPPETPPIFTPYEFPEGSFPTEGEQAIAAHVNQFGERIAERMATATPETETALQARVERMENERRQEQFENGCNAVMAQYGVTEEELLQTIERDGALPPETLAMNALGRRYQEQAMTDALAQRTQQASSVGGGTTAQSGGDVLQEARRGLPPNASTQQIVEMYPGAFR